MLFGVFQAGSREQDSVCATHLMVKGTFFMARDANVKRARMAAENVDAAAGHSRMLPILVLGPGENRGGSRQARASVVERGRTVCVGYAALGSFDYAPQALCHSTNL